MLEICFFSLTTVSDQFLTDRLIRRVCGHWFALAGDPLSRLAVNPEPRSVTVVNDDEGCSIPLEVAQIQNSLF